MEGGMQPGVEPGTNFLISKMADTALILSNNMASSSSHSEQLIHVSFINLMVSKCIKYICKVLFILLFLPGFPAIAFFFVMLLSCD